MMARPASDYRANGRPPHPHMETRYRRPKGVKPTKPSCLPENKSHRRETARYAARFA